MQFALAGAEAGDIEGTKRNAVSLSGLKPKLVDVDQSGFHRVHHDGGGVFHPQFVHDVFAVGIYGVWAEKELLGDGRIGVPFRDEGDDFLLALGELNRRTGEILEVLVVGVDVVAVDGFQYLAAKEFFASGSVLNGRNDFAEIAVFFDVAAYSGFQRADDGGAVLCRGDRDHPRVGRGFQRPRYGYQMKPGSGEIHDHHLGLVSLQHGDQSFFIAGNGDYPDVARTFQHGLQPQLHQWIAVSNNHRNFFAHRKG